MQAFVLASLVALQPSLALGDGRFNPHGARKHAIELMESGETRQMTAEAVDGLLGRAAELLAEAGRDDVAGEISSEWRDHYRMVTMGALGDMGDHAPLSDWLAAAYDRIEAVLGPDLCDKAHLSDLKVFNFTTPVVFHPHAAELWCTEHLGQFPESSCAPEYRRHFAGTKWQRDDDPGATARLHFGFAPVATYWIVFAACEGALWGTDGTLACSPIAGVSEVAIARYVAPKVSQDLWQHFNPGE